MRSHTPTLHCDADLDCPEWSVDYYEITASTVDGVRITTTERAPGWLSTDGTDLCPEHRTECQHEDTRVVATDPASGVTEVACEAPGCDWREVG